MQLSGENYMGVTTDVGTVANAIWMSQQTTKLQRGLYVVSIGRPVMFVE